MRRVSGILFSNNVPGYSPRTVQHGASAACLPDLVLALDTAPKHTDSFATVSQMQCPRPPCIRQHHHDPAEAQRSTAQDILPGQRYRQCPRQKATHVVAIRCGCGGLHLFIHLRNSRLLYALYEKRSGVFETRVPISGPLGTLNRRGPGKGEEDERGQKEDERGKTRTGEISTRRRAEGWRLPFPASLTSLRTQCFGGYSSCSSTVSPLHPNITK